MNLPQRKNSLRLKDYDYSQSGAYFVTIATYRRLHLLGEIQQGEMQFSELGKLATALWAEIPKHFSSIELDVFVIMPNHLHGILLLHNNTTASPNLSQVINSYKGAVSRSSKGIVEGQIWQRSFHDHIIRNQREYDYIAQYVATNPLRWEEDSLRYETE